MIFRKSESQPQLGSGLCQLWWFFGGHQNDSYAHTTSQLLVPGQGLGRYSFDLHSDSFNEFYYMHNLENSLIRLEQTRQVVAM